MLAPNVSAKTLFRHDRRCRREPREGDTLIDTPSELLDCVIVGGGAGGLTAAIYLARFARNALLVDAGGSRLSSIPTSHNYPGFPQGVSGVALHDLLKAQAARYGTRTLRGTVTHISRTEQGFFVAIIGEKTLFAKTVVLATGATDVAPEIAGFAEALKSAVLRYCPICDGFEAIGKKVGVLGSGAHGVKESLFIRHYATDLTLIALSTRSGVPQMDMKELANHGIKVIDGNSAALVAEHGQIAVYLRDGSKHLFEVLYSASGLTVSNALAQNLGLKLDDMGQVRIDEHMQSSMHAVYAIGDVAHGLNQISVATGQAAIAATAIHNLLCTVDSANVV